MALNLAAFAPLYGITRFREEQRQQAESDAINQLRQLQLQQAQNQQKALGFLGQSARDLASGALNPFAGTQAPPPLTAPILTAGAGTGGGLGGGSQMPGADGAPLDLTLPQLPTLAGGPPATGGFAGGPGGGMLTGLPNDPLSRLKQQVLGLEGNRDVYGAAGEIGPGQIMPSTGAQYGYAPDQLWGESGRLASGRIVEDLYGRSGGDPAATLVGYNRGPGAMQRFQAAGDDPDAVKLAPNYQRAVANAVSTQAIGQYQSGVPFGSVQQSAGIANAAGSQIPRMNWQRPGMMQAIAQEIERIAPDADPVVKAYAMQGLQAMMAPQEKMYFEQVMQQHKEDLDIWKVQQENYRAGLQQQAGGELIETPDQGIVAYNPKTRQITPVQGIPAGSHKLGTRAEGEAGGTGFAQSKLLEITDSETGEVRQVLAREGRGKVGWVDSMTGQPLKLKASESAREVTPAAAGGGRAGAQIGRQLTAGAEVALDLQSVINRPLGATTGLFGSVTPGKSPLSALANDITPFLTADDDRRMQMAFAGLGRELSTLMSPVYGGNWASDQLVPLMPRVGDSLMTTLYGFARVKQSAVNALESLLPSSYLNKDQKGYARDLMARMNKAIPWTVKDVDDFEQADNPQETFGEYAKRMGIGGGQADAETKAGASKGQPKAGEGDTRPLQPGMENDPDGTGYNAPDGSGVWVKKGGYLIKTPAGEATAR